jgi:hypothetical protein
MMSMDCPAFCYVTSSEMTFTFWPDGKAGFNVLT